MSEAVLIAIISGAVTLAVCMINNNSQNKKIISELDKHSELHTMQIEELDKKVEKHNQVIERVFELEKQEGIISEKLKKLEGYHQ